MARILIVDDSLYQRLKVRRFLERQGHQVTEASNGREALALAVADAPEVMILDLIMPEVGGLEVLWSLPTVECRFPVIVLSADIQETTRREALALGAIWFVNKPWKEEELVQALALALGPAAPEIGDGQ